MAMRHVSREETLGAHSPARVRRATNNSTTDQIAHECSKIMLVTAGTAQLTFAGGEITLSAGQVAALSHGHWYAGSTGSNVETTTMYIDTGYLHEQSRWIPTPDKLIGRIGSPSSSPAPIVLQLSAQDQLTLDNILGRVLVEELNPSSPFGLLARITEVLDFLARCAPQEPSYGPSRHLAVLRATDILSNDLGHEWTVRELAKCVSLSPSQLTRQFLREFGVGPAEYLRRERVRRMTEVLLGDAETVEAAARAAGWTSPSHASRAFRQIHGISPQQFRRSGTRSRISTVDHLL